MAQRVDRLAARLVAEDQLRRIAGDDPHEHEDERQHREQRDEREREAADEERGHGRSVRRALRQRSRHFVKRVFSVIGGDRFSEPFIG